MNGGGQHDLLDKIEFMRISRLRKTLQALRLLNLISFLICKWVERLRRNLGEVEGLNFLGLVEFTWVEMPKVDTIGVWYLDLFDFVALEHLGGMAYRRYRMRGSI